MLGSPVASNPYAIMCFVSLFTFVAALAALSAFKYAVFLMLVTAYSLILCQYRPNVPGFHGTVHIFYDRLVDIAIGVLVVLLLDLILPWYAFASCMLTEHHALPCFCLQWPQLELYMWLNTIKLTIRMLAYIQCGHPCFFVLCGRGLAATPAELVVTSFTESFTQVVKVSCHITSLIGQLHLVLSEQYLPGNPVICCATCDNA
jgi:hypothetical protein